MKYLLLSLILLSACTAPVIEIPEDSELRVATLAGGCFWCIEAAIEPEEGVIEVISGYTGGEVQNPSYTAVSLGLTGHYEAVQVYYNPEIITYEEILNLYWRQIDPTDSNGQFADRGSQYKTAIFYGTEEEMVIALRSKKNLDDSGKFEEKIVTEILPVQTFYPAEEYHQDYYKKRTTAYERYAEGSGRKSFVKETWG